MAQSIEEILAASPLFYALKPSHVRILSAHATTVGFDEDEYIFHAHEPANAFYLIQEGEVALEVDDPVQGKRVLQVLHAGDVLGWSWLFAPYEWHLDAHALTLVRTLIFDAAFIRAKCDQNHTLGYELMQRFSQMMLQRLQMTLLQRADNHLP